MADVFQAYQIQFLQRWGHVVSDQQHKALRDIGRCRTAALGTHLERCDRCNYETVAYDSCRNRHCPKCKSSARDRWLMKQASSLLPVPYAHVVFTVPEQLAPLALRNQRLFYNLMFRAASETLLEIAADSRHLGARIGVLAVLHTWSQNLGLHPHLHCLVPAGGLALDRSRWVASRRNFFLPVRVLSRMFRDKLLAFLKQSHRHNQLCFSGTLTALSQPRAFHSLLSALRSKEWVVYSKPPFGGPEHVLRYLARYTHRVAISNGRLLGLENGQVRFRWRDSRRTQPILSPVQARYPAPSPTALLWCTSQIEVTACTHIRRLILRNIMPTCNPTRFLGSQGGHPANAVPGLESAPHYLDARHSLLSSTPECTLEPTRRAHRNPLRA